MNCPECNGAVKTEIKGSSQVTYCTNCDWSVATTYIEPIREDETIYTVSTKADNLDTKEAIVAVSKVANCNYLQAKTLLSNSGEILFRGEAEEVQTKLAILKQAHVPYKIDPSWPY